MALTVFYCDNCGSPCVYPQPPSHLVLASYHYVYVNVSCIAAEVMIGKGVPRQALSQIGGMVRNGKSPADQTKTTNGFRIASKDLGKGW